LIFNVIGVLMSLRVFSGTALTSGAPARRAITSPGILAGTSARLQTRRAIFVLFVLACAAGATVWAAYPAPLRVPAARGVVAADHPDAARAGALMLARHGNACDAAVATALALGVVSPGGSGLGGGGFLLYYGARDKKVRALDFRETAPRAAGRDMYLVNGRAVPEKSRWGGLAVAVPGEPAGLAELEAHCGKLGLAAVVEPAARLARDGFTASPHLAVSAARVLERLGAQADEPLRALLRPGGRAMAPGDKLRNEALARTLLAFGQGGPAAIYRGAIGREWVAAVKRTGGVMTEDDLDAYRARWREPLEIGYRGHRVFGPPAPSGGPTALETLAILDARPPLAPLGWGSSAALHAIAEALKHAFADRARRLGDPAFLDATPNLTDPAYVRQLAAHIADDKTQKTESYGGKEMTNAPADPPHDHGTSHLCVVDGDGNAVALTTTINLGFGAALVGGSTGVLLNDEMDDFSSQPGVPNAYGLIGGFANAIQPGKRPLSSMSPLLAFKDGRPTACVGGSGGPLIVSETVQALTNVVDFGQDPLAAVSAPRIHAQWMPDVLIAEPEIPADVLDGLRRRGHKVVPPPPWATSAAQMIVVKPESLEAAADPRKGGAPAAP
jgi:gamma-glutamyltranspeptidase / glutathione hydrolase